MALLIIGLDKHIGSAKAWRDTFKEQLPDLQIRIWPEAGELGGHRISRLHASRFRQAPRLPEFESHVQPLGRRGVLHQASQAAEGPARQSGAAGRRSHDDGIRRHARSAFPSRHARLSGGAGQSRMAQGADHPARAKARRLPGLRHDGASAGAGVEVARLQGLRVGPLAAAGRRGPHLPRPRSARAVSQSRPISPSACCR